LKFWKVGGLEVFWSGIAGLRNLEEINMGNAHYSFMIFALFPAF
jgi:hypothetical protein